MESHTVIISFRPTQIKLFQSKKKSLLVIEAVCTNGSKNRISPGHAALVHIRPTSLLTDGAQSTSRNDTNANAVTNVAQRLVAGTDSLPLLHKGTWVVADSSKIVAVRALANMERNRKGTRVVECIDLLSLQPDGQFLPIGGDKTEFDDCTDDHQDYSQSDHYINDKSERHKIFSRWIVKTYGTDLLSRGSGVLDVAGGNGMISQT
eukprot:CCRYP_013715-RA/>CCRYP_013715-RA protein AED:0.37 eAED:0.37 QI:0/-1/0/1/-1/1/1/0/205